jgi:hypothetical protein
MKIVLVWVILAATACAGKCAVDVESAPFIRSGLVISEGTKATTFADRLIWPLGVKIFANHSLRIRKVRQANERSSAAWTTGGRLEQSRHVPTVAYQHGPRNASQRLGIYRRVGKHDGGSPL